jgi:hypothetical protein
VLSEGRAVLLKSYGDPMFANSISLYEPINQYKPIADCIGFVDGPLVHMSYPGLIFIKIPFPTRMTVIQLSNGDSWLHSPIAYQAELANAIEAMGPIRHIVSPNKIHYAHVQEWKDAFPDAITWASPGVRERARSQGIAVHFDRDLSQTAPQQWEVDLLQTMVPGSYLNEVVFFFTRHQRRLLSRTSSRASSSTGLSSLIASWCGRQVPTILTVKCQSIFAPPSGLTSARSVKL